MLIATFCVLLLIYYKTIYFQETFAGLTYDNYTFRVSMWVICVECSDLRHFQKKITINSAAVIIMG